MPGANLQIRLVLLLALLLPLSAGCVERKLVIRSDPPDATVVLNGQEVGKTPYSDKFLFYGDYGVLLAAPNHYRLQEVARLRPPWFERFPLDLFTECFWPGTLTDVQEFTYTLKPMGNSEEVSSEENDALLQRADDLRNSVRTFGGVNDAPRKSDAAK
jgi:hypothetical protein